MTVGVGVAHHLLAEFDQFAIVLGGDAADDVAAHAANGSPFLFGETDGGQGLHEIVRDAADGVVSIGESVEREVEIDDEIGTALEKVRDNGFHLCGKKAVGREIHVTHAVVDVEELDDLGEIFAEERFAARDPKLVKSGRSLADALELIEGEIVAFVQFVPVKAGAAQRIAGRGDEEKHGLQGFGAEYAACVMEVLEPHECSCAEVIVDDGEGVAGGWGL